MRRVGFIEHWSAAVIEATTRLSPRASVLSLKKVNRFFLKFAGTVPEGLDQLPACWFKALPGILSELLTPERPYLPVIIQRVSMTGGTMMLELQSENPDLAEGIHVMLNAKLYPSRWRPLHKRHLAELKLKRPELRQCFSPPDGP